MVTHEDCPFCEIVQREDPDAREVYRDEHVVAFAGQPPAGRGGDGHRRPAVDHRIRGITQPEFDALKAKALA